MIPRGSGATAAFALLLLIGGCFLPRSQDPPFGPEPSSRTLTLYVTNLAFADATLYSVIGSARHRLGRVSGTTEAVFTVPLAFPTDMHIEINLLAGPTCYTDRMAVNPGDELALRIENDGANWYCTRT